MVWYGLAKCKLEEIQIAGIELSICCIRLSVRMDYVPNSTQTEPGWWRSTLVVDTIFDYAMNGQVTCQVTYGNAPPTNSTSTLAILGEDIL